MPISFNVQIGFPGTMVQHVLHYRIFDWLFQGFDLGILTSLLNVLAPLEDCFKFPPGKVP